MLTTTKKAVRILTSLFVKHQIREVVLSPGTRNAPLLVALEREPRINTKLVIDERSAGFVALGESCGMGNKPVAMVCTSGTAPLNYAPAVAEAYYRRVPLIVVTADRPAQWIDQSDSQTIRQPGIYANFIKASFDIPAEDGSAEQLVYINRMINDALITAVSGTPGPVHINMQLDDPLGELEEVDDSDTCGEDTRYTGYIGSKPELDGEVISCLLRRMPAERNILILLGFMPPRGLEQALRKIAEWPNVVVMHEAQSNVSGEKLISNIDATLSQIHDRKDKPYSPDLVITIGGSMTSNMVKAWLRSIKGLEHWHIGRDRKIQDTFRCQSLVIESTPQSFLDELVKLKCKGHSEDSQYKRAWLNAYDNAKTKADKWAFRCPWSDFKAMHTVMNWMPRWNLQLSNGTAVRYAQLFKNNRALRTECNRGVSGIDGCTSTAIGFAAVSKAPTLTITGDMSMQYDIGALACTFIPPSFRIIVLNNGGGGIFRFIKTTRNLAELDKDFVADVRLPLAKLAEGYGMDHYVAEDEESLKLALKKLEKETGRPAILEIKTDGAVSARTLTEYFKTN